VDIAMDDWESLRIGDDAIELTCDGCQELITKAALLFLVPPPSVLDLGRGNRGK